ncbi:MAG TPA: hypothetical protein VIF59_07640, partial [Methylomirabilota bacterium]
MRLFTRRRLLIAVIALVALVTLAATSLFFSDEPLRRYTEAKINARLKGYSATIGSLDYNPVSFSLDLRDIVIVQDEHPDPPVA